jgi:diaminopimelate decarboxylase
MNMSHDGLLTSLVRELALELARTGGLPAFVADLDALHAHTRHVREALPETVELFYAAKANSERPILETLADTVDGFDVASGGELTHLRDVVPSARLGLGGPGKTVDEIELALKLGVERFHVESVHELRLLAAITNQLDLTADVLLRVNLPVEHDNNVALVMGGRPSPFGLDSDAVTACTAIVREDPRLRLRGIHTHVASGVSVDGWIRVAEQVVAWADKWAQTHRIRLEEVNLGGGMGVDYTTPHTRFGWPSFGDRIGQLAASYPDVQLRIEPGRSMTAYAGYYITQVLDVRRSFGTMFAIVGGGTHHLRTPVTKGHNQPFEVVPVETWNRSWERPGVHDEAITVVGQLCTPKDRLATAVPVSRLRAGDVVAFAMAGAYGWNISHHDFLLHPAPSFHYV